jgi:ribosomal protein S18 acetylase RimI-like enzyme
MLGPVSEPVVIREAVGWESDVCVDLWVRACAIRDGKRVEGVAERARLKFDRQVLWLIAEEAARVRGFALATESGSGVPTDPPAAVVLGLLAVSPDAQGTGLGRRLLRASAHGLAVRGYGQAVLHVLIDNVAAVKLYESERWQRHGDPFEHALLHRMSQTYTLDL